MSTPPCTIYRVRHAESQPSSEVPEPEWRLSTRGAKQARALVSSLRGLGAVAIYASPYLRAVQTFEPLAIALGMDVALIEVLRERALGRVDLGADHAALVERYWADPDFALPGGESNAACARRVAPAIAQLHASMAGETIIIASHGNAIAIFLSTIDPRFGVAQWRAMRNPDLFRVVYDGARATWTVGDSMNAVFLLQSQCQ